SPLVCPKFSDWEIITTDLDVIKVVTQDAYNSAFAQLNAIRTGAGWGPYTFASNFLYSFMNNMPLAGATSEVVKLRANTDKLTHNVGAQFGPNGDADILYNSFGEDSDFSQAIADSSEFRGPISAQFDAILQQNGSAIIEYFQT